MIVPHAHPPRKAFAGVNTEEDGVAGSYHTLGQCAGT